MTKPIESETGTALAAVIYLRVSTPDQLNTAIDIDPDGNSIATQRDFCHRRATGLDAAVQKEFVEPGTSAQSIDKRPVFKQLLAYLDEHTEITHVIVYMRSRAFRNYTDAAVTKRRLAEKGVKLLSAKEDFGEGYIADAMEGIIDIFNELESRQTGRTSRPSSGTRHSTVAPSHAPSSAISIPVPSKTAGSSTQSRSTNNAPNS